MYLIHCAHKYTQNCLRLSFFFIITDVKMLRNNHAHKHTILQEYFVSKISYTKAPYGNNLYKNYCGMRKTVYCRNVDLRHETLWLVNWRVVSIYLWTEHEPFWGQNWQDPTKSRNGLSAFAESTVYDLAGAVCMRLLGLQRQTPVVHWGTGKGSNGYWKGSIPETIFSHFIHWKKILMLFTFIHATCAWNFLGYEI